MPSPVTPSDILTSIPSLTGRLCTRFKTAMRIPKLFYDLLRYERDDAGKLSEAYIADMCSQLSCLCGTTGGAGDLAAPVIAATDGSYADKIVITWNTMVEATSGFDIYRNTVNDTSTAVRIASVAAGVYSYDDESSNVNGATAGQVYFYWVRAKAGLIYGPYSEYDTGYVSNPGATGDELWEVGGTYIWTAAFTGLYQIECVGAGGAGGPAQGAAGVCQNSQVWGGGGGGGGYSKKINVALNSGDQLAIQVGIKNSITATAMSFVANVSGGTVLCSAAPGSPGSAGAMAQSGTPPYTTCNRVYGTGGTGGLTTGSEYIGDTKTNGEDGVSQNPGYSGGNGQAGIPPLAGRGGSGAVVLGTSTTAPAGTGNDGCVRISW